MSLKVISPCSFCLLIVLLISLSCNKNDLPPVAVLKVFPPFGDTSIFFELCAAGSEDDRCYDIALQYRWDFEGDGVWDTEYSKTNAIAHKFKKSGKYNVTVNVKNIDGLSDITSDSIEVFGMNPYIDTLVDSRDGNRYRIVKINNRWWMAENLSYGKVIPTDREQTDNDTIEMYRDTDSEHFDTIGGIYLWREAMNYQITKPQGICPDGWHIPTKPEWEALFTPFLELDYGKLGLYSMQYYRKDGPSNLNLDLNNGAVRWEDGTFLLGTRSSHRGFWSSDSSWDREYWDYYPYLCMFNSEVLLLIYDYWYDRASSLVNSYYLSVRCVKDN